MEILFKKASALIDAKNELDPTKEFYNGISFPKELLYSKRLYQKLMEFCPDASEAIQIAAKAQHICRWKIARETFSMDRVGYLKWREELKSFHAKTTADILKNTGYDTNFINRVSFLIEKKLLKKDTETQLLEDVVCLVFLEFYLEPFVLKHDKEKLLVIIRKTWNKMSPKGHEEALKLNISASNLELIREAME